ncbi:MAG: hypothetical protein K0Q76_2135 [Panacagrimonas sp.]|jgi:hypothetical protein|nr:hypothetical protein [Panacagrimonas sp.]MCC2657027.1 hypothetical protein [Panacagrimonas sp.]
MTESLPLFPFFEIAMRAVAILILCVLPVLMLSLPSGSRKKLVTTPND